MEAPFMTFESFDLKTLNCMNNLPGVLMSTPEVIVTMIIVIVMVIVGWVRVPPIGSRMVIVVMYRDGMKSIMIVVMRGRGMEPTA